MKFNFHAEPVVFVAPINGKKYIVGTMPWVEYTPELFEEAKEAYKQHKQDATVQMQESVIEVASKSDPTKKYKVTVTSDGRYSCECKGYQFRKSCAHIEKVKGNK